MQEFANRVVLITGAGSGIGREMARRLVAAGALVGALDRQREPLQEMAASCPEGSFAWATADVTSPLALNQAFAELIGKLGPVDILVASAGVGHETRAA